MNCVSYFYYFNIIVCLIGAILGFLGLGIIALKSNPSQLLISFASKSLILGVLLCIIPKVLKELAVTDNNSIILLIKLLSGLVLIISILIGLFAWNNKHKHKHMKIGE